MLGLNISASFNSAVTIYILIPLLVIPQLLLSGVVISFDKFNPRVGKPVGVPVMGEVMASRWAFEALMVTQFRDNPFEKQFFEFDKDAAVAEYKRVYFIPELESKLSFVLNNQQYWRNANNEKMVGALNVLKDGFTTELELIGKDKFPDVDKIEIGKFDSTIYKSSVHFLTTLKKYYQLKKDRALEKREQLIAERTKTPELSAKFERLKMRYENQTVMDAVKNINSPDRIIEFDERLVQKIYPIYQDAHTPAHYFDFSANLYQPTKYFMGRTFDTFYFNLAVIWSMTFFLFITLYFDALHRLIVGVENRLKYRKRTRD